MRSRPFMASSHLDLVEEVVPVGGGNRILHFERAALGVVRRPQDTEAGTPGDNPSSRASPGVGILPQISSTERAIFRRLAPPGPPIPPSRPPPPLPPRPLTPVPPPPTSATPPGAKCSAPRL